MPRALSAALLYILLATFTAAAADNADKPYGRPGDARRVKRVIVVDMSDAMRFFPEAIYIKRGDTVRFELRNGGELPHDMTIGTMDELKKRAALARKNQDASQVNEADGAVPPGGKRRLVWHFPRPGEYYFACLVPGHFEAGMIGTIVVR